MSGLIASISQSLAGRFQAQRCAAAGAEPVVRADNVMLFRAPGTLHAQGTESIYRPVSDADATIALVQLPNDGSAPHDEDDEVGEAPVQFRLVVHDGAATGGGLLLSQDLADGLTIRFFHPRGVVMWTALTEGVPQELAFRFTSDASVDGVAPEVAKLGSTADPQVVSKAFVDLYNQCVYFTLTKSRWQPSAKGEETATDVQYSTAGYTAQASPVDDGASVHDDAAYAYDGTNEDDGTQLTPAGGAALSTGGSAGRNVCFADALRYQRAIVVRDGGAGNKTEIVAHSYAAGSATLEQRVQLDRRVAEARDATLTDECARLLLATTISSPVNDSTGVVAEVDLERGSVCAQYAPGLGYDIRRLAPANKTTQCNPQLVTALCDTVALTIDRRMDPNTAAVVEDLKNITDYSLKLSKPRRFTCHATSASGALAVGDRAGNIRLYTGPPGARRETGKGHHPKAAKTLIEASPLTPINHLDITADATYILATCKTFLLVLCAEYVEAKSEKSTSGFQSRMGSQKPLPVRLQLSAQQIAAIGGPSKVEFSKATFETNADGEHWIAASCGPLIVTWNFAAVKKAIASRRIVACQAVSKGAPVRAVTVSASSGPGEQLKFMTDDTMAMETIQPERAPKRGKVRFELPK